MSGLFIAAAFFLILGLVLEFTNGENFTIGLSFVATDDRENIDRKKLNRFMGLMLFAYALCMTIGGLGEVLEIRLLTVLCLVLFVAAIALTIILLRNSKRFEKPKPTDDE